MHNKRRISRNSALKQQTIHIYNEYREQNRPDGQAGQVRKKERRIYTFVPADGKADGKADKRRFLKEKVVSIVLNSYF